MSRQKAIGWCTRDSSGFFSPFYFTRRVNGDTDVTIKVLYCGICRSDLESAKNDFGFTVYPFVPGHEIVGEVVEAGSKVEKLKVGDKVGVGFMIDSCRSCESCSQNMENYCPLMVPIFTASPLAVDVTYGGFSDIMVVHERYTVCIPDGVSLPGIAPLFCAGITVYSSMKYYGLCSPGTHIGIVGLGGLGHVAVKFAKAFGLKVTVISTSPNKRHEAIHTLGADSFILSRDAEQMKQAMGSLDGIIDTITAPKSLPSLIALLKSHGKLVFLGSTIEPLEVFAIPMHMGRKMMGGSFIGGTKEMQEMVNFAAQHKITADVEVIPMSYLNTAMDRLGKGDIKYRFVIDMANTLSMASSDENADNVNHQENPIYD